MKNILVTLALLALIGCSSTAKQSDQFLIKDAPAISQKIKIINVPYIRQSLHHCGPAAMAMVMNYKGHEVSADELAKQIYTPGQKGSLPSDILGSTRRNGMMAIPVNSISDLIKELSAGNPVLIFENLGLTWYPIWHYAVAVGYDVTEPAIILHSGNNRYLRTNLKVFERSWKLTNYWGLAVLHPHEKSASGTELAHAAAAAGLEESGKLKEAEEAYKMVLKHWPDSLPALIGLGNVHYTTNDLYQSLRYLKQAKRKHPTSEAVKNNLKVAQQALAEN